MSVWKIELEIYHTERDDFEPACFILESPVDIPKIPDLKDQVYTISKISLVDFKPMRCDKEMLK